MSFTFSGFLLKIELMTQEVSISPGSLGIILSPNPRPQLGISHRIAFEFRLNILDTRRPTIAAVTASDGFAVEVVIRQRKVGPEMTALYFGVARLLRVVVAVVLVVKKKLLSREYEVRLCCCGLKFSVQKVFSTHIQQSVPTNVFFLSVEKENWNVV